MIFQILKAHFIEHPNRNNRMNKLIYIPNKTSSYTSTNLRNKIKTIVQNNIISHPLTNHLSSSSQFQFRSITSEKFDNPPTQLIYSYDPDSTSSELERNPALHTHSSP